MLDGDRFWAIRDESKSHLRKSRWRWTKWTRYCVAVEVAVEAVEAELELDLVEGCEAMLSNGFNSFFEAGELIQVWLVVVLISRWQRAGTT